MLVACCLCVILLRVDLTRILIPEPISYMLICDRDQPAAERQVNWLLKVTFNVTIVTMVPFIVPTP
jgi:hypothetical protein